ncbi:MAG TPA: sigma-70 family RNA polymerase sigma factor [Pyrinomonadaceae bacterium]
MSDEDWTIDEEDFERLLAHLATDRDVAAERFATIWRNLVRTFASRRCHEAEDVADETMFRVARKTRTLKKYTGDFALYIYRVGSFVCREWLRRYRKWLRLHPDVPPPESPPPPEPPDEEPLDCLDQCLDALPAEDREIAVEYYRFTGRERIENRRRLGEKFNLSPNALRIRAHKLRAQLRGCVERCLGRAGGA